MRRLLVLVAALALLFGGVHAVPVTQTTTETITHSVGAGGSPSVAISETVTQTISLATSYSDTLGPQVWRYIRPRMTNVGQWYVQFEMPGTEPDVAKVRVVAGTDSLDFLSDQVFRAYCFTDSTDGLDRVAIQNTHNDSTLTYHVIVTGE